ncbi:MAG: hypothetical protein WD737_11440 [Gemmatimonadota bacterium]
MKLLEYLGRSSAVPDFRAAIEQFLASGRPSERVAFGGRSPIIKVERTLTKLLEAYADLPIESVEIAGRSGCEFFRGEAVVRTADAERRIRFDWDCKWKAQALGWTDYFGFPDQTRAAREFGHDCFRGWEEQTVDQLAEA